MPTCEDCSSFGLRFDREYQPYEFIEGNRNARIWIIGLNPAKDPDWKDDRDTQKLKTYFDDENSVPGYFKQFKSVSSLLYEQLGKDKGVAHTDLVKCSSKSWPPSWLSGTQRTNVIANCTKHLRRQLEESPPEMIICNGVEVSAEIKRLLPPPNGTPESATSYRHSKKDGSIVVILSGFIGRIDNYSKRRFGHEIESFLAALPEEA